MPDSSFKKVVSHLDKSLRQIANLHIHKPIEIKEVLPVEEEIDFKAEINTLIGRIIERLPKEEARD